MCGIIGYKGKGNATQIAIEGLKRLEYRGYDSWGIAIKKGKKIKVIKKVGKIGEFSAEKSLPKSFTAISHTRWATAGSVTENNAHPHLSCDKKIAVVHNGIVENHEKLKKELRSKGHKFVSDTDTEVIPHLIEEYQKQGSSFEEAFKKALSKLEGDYAIVAINQDSEKMIGSRKERPLVIGQKDGEVFFASDVLAFLNHTNKVKFLEEEDTAIANKHLVIKDKDGKIAKRPIKEIAMDPSAAEKGDFPHFMLKEIYDQQGVLEKTSRIDKKELGLFTEKIKDSEKVLFIACGTAYYSAIMGTYIFSKIAKKQTTAILASEFLHYIPFINKKTLVIPISQSGETADVLYAVKDAKKKGACVTAIINTEGSSLTREADYFIHTKAGPEIAVAATKSFTAQIALLTLIAYAYANKTEEGRKVILDAAKNSKRIFNPDNLKKLKKLASIIKNKEHIYTMGKGEYFPLALESALKIKELSYSHAEGFAGAELKHGPIALIEDKTPCIVFSNEKDIICNSSEVKSRGAFVIGVGEKEERVFDYLIKIPKTKMPSLLSIIPMQLLAYYLALEKGCDVDRPRNLAKSVTVV